MRPILFLLFALTGFVSGCDTSDDDPPRSSQCGVLAEVDESRWRSANTERYFIEAVTLEGDCLEITLGSSGCNGETWEARLFDAAAIAESLPVQRSIRVDFSNEELCNAAISRSFTFDVTPLRANGEDTVLFNLDGWEELIRYEYSD